MGIRDSVASSGQGSSLVVVAVLEHQRTTDADDQRGTEDSERPTVVLPRIRVVLPWHPS